MTPVTVTCGCGVVDAFQFGHALRAGEVVQFQNSHWVIPGTVEGPVEGASGHYFVRDAWGRRHVVSSRVHVKEVELYHWDEEERLYEDGHVEFGRAH